MKLRLICKWLYNFTLTFKISTFIENKSQVSKEEVKEFCDQNDLDVVYTSSKYGVGIETNLTNFVMRALEIREADYL